MARALEEYKREEARFILFGHEARNSAGVGD